MKLEIKVYLMRMKIKSDANYRLSIVGLKVHLRVSLSNNYSSRRIHYAKLLRIIPRFAFQQDIHSIGNIQYELIYTIIILLLTVILIRYFKSILQNIFMFINIHKWILSRD